MGERARVGKQLDVTRGSPQINFSVVVDEEQQRQAGADDDVREAQGFVSASTVPLDDPPSPPKTEAPLHPMFRQGSESSLSRASSVAPTKGRRRTSGTRTKVEDDVIEILSSEDELDEPSPEPPTAVGPDGET